jgi:hypothetical protein
MEWTEVLRNMSLKKKGLLACAVIIMIIMTYRHLTYEPGYCSAKKHLISDAEFIDKSVRLFKSQIEYFGGIDAYERHLIEINKHPEEAGRDFDINDPNCCKVYRSERSAASNCGIGDYPICVRLYFPEFKEPPKGHIYYKREGRTYIFNDCGELKEEY